MLRRMYHSTQLSEPCEKCGQADLRLCPSSHRRPAPRNDRCHTATASCSVGSDGLAFDPLTSLCTQACPAAPSRNRSPQQCPQQPQREAVVMQREHVHLKIASDSVLATLRQRRLLSCLEERVQLAQVAHVAPVIVLGDTFSSSIYHAHLLILVEGFVRCGTACAADWCLLASTSGG